MRTPDQTPLSPTEQYIEDVLVAHGANKDNIQFRHEVNASRVIRYGYWRRLTDDVQEILKGFIEECDYDDDDCGTLYFYNIIPSKK